MSEIKGERGGEKDGKKERRRKGVQARVRTSISILSNGTVPVSYTARGAHGHHLVVEGVRGRVRKGGGGAGGRGGHGGRNGGKALVAGVARGRQVQESVVRLVQVLSCSAHRSHHNTYSFFTQRYKYPPIFLFPPSRTAVCRVRTTASSAPRQIVTYDTQQVQARKLAHGGVPAHHDTAGAYELRSPTISIPAISFNHIPLVTIVRGSTHPPSHTTRRQSLHDTAAARDNTRNRGEGREQCDLWPVTQRGPLPSGTVMESRTAEPNK